MDSSSPCFCGEAGGTVASNGWNEALRQSAIDRKEFEERDVFSLLQQHKKTEAIRAYRLYAGAGLAAAKEHVERLEQESAK